MKHDELTTLQKYCLSLWYLIQKNIDAYDDDLAETYSAIIDELNSLNLFIGNVLEKEKK